MPWINRIKAETHKCKKPKIISSWTGKPRVEPGSLWQCKKCGDAYRVDFSAWDGLRWVFERSADDRD